MGLLGDWTQLMKIFVLKGVSVEFLKTEKKKKKPTMESNMHNGNTGRRRKRKEQKTYLKS